MYLLGCATTLSAMLAAAGIITLIVMGIIITVGILFNLRLPYRFIAALVAFTVLAVLVIAAVVKAVRAVIHKKSAAS
jgi:hypothetical protein